MTDIVERLRAPAYWFSGSSEGHEGENSAPYEAADEIERLRAALRLIAEHPVEQSGQWEIGSKEMLKVARAALEGK